MKKPQFKDKTQIKKMMISQFYDKTQIKNCSAECLQIFY